MNLITLLPLTVSLMLLLVSAQEDVINEDAMIDSLNNHLYAHFGTSVDVDGLYMIVGAPDGSWYPGVTDPGRGVAYIYSRPNTSSNEWSEMATLSNSDLYFTRQFGHSVAISGSIAVVSSASENEPGSVQVHDANVQGTDYNEGWRHVQHIYIYNTNPTHGFGWSVALENSTLVVGSPLENGLGAVHVYERDDNSVWIEAATLSSESSTSGTRFGQAVALSGGVIVVGGPQQEALAGAAYIFHRAGQEWRLASRVFPDELNGLFGSSVAIFGSFAVIGAPGQAYTSGSGHAYVFELAEDEDSEQPWELTFKVECPGPSSVSQFGSSVAVGENGVIAVGAHDDWSYAVEALGPGAVFSYRPHKYGPGWIEEGVKYVASSPETGAGFGASIVIDGLNLVVGAPGQDTEFGQDAGAVFALTGCFDCGYDPTEAAFVGMIILAGSLGMAVIGGTAAVVTRRRRRNGAESDSDEGGVTKPKTELPSYAEATAPPSYTVE